MPIPHKCPVCDGCGRVSRPPGVAGDVQGFSSTSAGPYRCRPCMGTGIIWGPGRAEATSNDEQEIITRYV